MSLEKKVILTGRDGVELTVFDDKYTFPQSEGWTVRLTPAEAALLAARLLKLAGEVDY